MEEGKRGFAPIKEKYLKSDHKPSFDPTYVPKKIANDIFDVISNEKLGSPAGESINTHSKKKLRGKNKNRPIEKRPQDHNKLCPSIVAGRTCLFNDQCKFSHNVELFLVENPEELKGPCYCYVKYGHCPYGVTCMYRSQHININNENITNPNIFDPDNTKKSVLNCISKDLQIRLRKREYSFDETLSNKKQKMIQEGHNEEIIDNKNEFDISEKQKNVDGLNESPRTLGCLTDEDVIKLRPCEKKQIDFRGKLYLAPLTTVGNLPFRRVCKDLGVEITCGEMAMSSNLLQGQSSEWALLKRHHSESIFGVQLCGSNPDCVSRAAKVICQETEIDFIDINIGCPIDLVNKRGDGCAMMGRLTKLQNLVTSVVDIANCPITLKMRNGIHDNKNIAHTIMPKVKDWGLSLVTIHGRSREQRYTKLADWDYIGKCADIVKPFQIFGNGDILSHESYYQCLESSKVDGALIARGALIKPWIFTEIQERRTWDISSSERFDIYKNFVNYGLEHWGSDKQGVSNTRKFLLEWLSFTHRYIPVGLMERLPQKINEKPLPYYGRDDLETLMGSPNCADWVKISEMLLGPVPTGFSFLPKHKANSFQ